MVERAKRRVLPWLLTVVLAALLAVSGVSILGVERAQAAAAQKSATSDGMDEDVDSSAVTSGTYNGMAYWSYSYTNSIQNFTVPSTGYYKLEVWGAQGGDASMNSGNKTSSGASISTALGGKGGYSVGVKYLQANTKLYVVTGGQGGKYTSSNTTGGYNGGGASTGCNSAGGGGGGGGATHIATRTGLLSSLSSYKSDVLIVAGGGGGAWGTPSYSWANYRGGSDGGYGGGLVGGGGGYGYSMGYTSVAANTNIKNQADGRGQAYFYATGGSQSAAGTKGQASGWTSSASNSQGTQTNGGFGRGYDIANGILIPAVPAAVAGMAVPAELPARMRMAPVAVVVRAILTV